MAVPFMNNDIIAGSIDRKTGQYTIAREDQALLLRIIGALVTPTAIVSLACMSISRAFGHGRQRAFICQFRRPYETSSDPCVLPVSIKKESRSCRPAAGACGVTNWSPTPIICAVVVLKTLLSSAAL